MKSTLLPWVPDGIYDYVDHKVRHMIRDGNPVYTLSKMWLDKGPPDDMPDELKLPWGSFPDLPLKPKK